MGPKRFMVTEKCHGGCSISEAALGPERHQMVHDWLEAGDSYQTVCEKGMAAGFRITQGSLGRHLRNHTTDEARVAENQDFGKLDELAALDAAIKQGQKNIPNWKMTPGEWMKAMELKLRLTQGTVFDGMLAAMAAAGAEDDDEGNQPEYMEEDGEGPGPLRESLPE